MDPLYIEDTEDWLGNPTSFETCRHQIRMYENEFETLTLQLERALENIQGLVRDNDLLTAERNSLREKLQYADRDLLSEKRSFADVAHQRDYLHGDLACSAFSTRLPPDRAGKDFALFFSGGHTFLQAKKYPIEAGLMVNHCIPALLNRDRLT